MSAPQASPSAIADRGGVIAVDLGGTKCHGVLADHDGVILAQDVRPTHGAGDASDSLLGCIATLQEVAASESVPVRAVVVGVPALIDPRTGLASAGPNVDWQGFDLIRLLADWLTIPFEVENDVNLAAVGQAWRGEGADVPAFVTLSIGTGIGGAVVVDGQLVRGRHNAGGEIGYLRLPVSDSSVQSVRFEDVASGKAIEARARALRKVLDGADETGPDVAALFLAAADGDELGRTVVSEVVRHVAEAIVNVTALLDPDVVILDGSVGRSLAPYAGQIKELVEPYVFGCPDVVCCGLEPNATVVGAIARALRLTTTAWEVGQR